MDYELKDFRKDVVEVSEKTPVVIDFWAAWCGPCRMLSPIIEKLAGEARGKWKLVTIDTEQFPEIAAQFGVRGIPSVKMVYQRAIIAEFQGAQPESAVRRWLQENLPTNGQEEEEEEGWEANLEKALSGGDRKYARSILEQALKKDRENSELKYRMAMLYLPGDYEKARELIESLDDKSKFEIEIQTVDTVGHMIKVAKGETNIKSNIPGLSESYRKGAISLIKSDFETALEIFLDCLVKDKNMDDEGARKACIAIFSMLGNVHPLTQKYRRRFSMALY